jgi:hypothetical protein
MTRDELSWGLVGFIDAKGASARVMKSLNVLYESYVRLSTRTPVMERKTFVKNVEALRSALHTTIPRAIREGVARFMKDGLGIPEAT